MPITRFDRGQGPGGVDDPLAAELRAHFAQEQLVPPPGASASQDPAAAQLPAATGGGGLPVDPPFDDFRGTGAVAAGGVGLPLTSPPLLDLSTGAVLGEPRAALPPTAKAGAVIQQLPFASPATTGPPAAAGTEVAPTSTGASASASGAASPISGLLGLPRDIVATGFTNPAALHTEAVIGDLQALLLRRQANGEDTAELSRTIAGLQTAASLM